MTARTCVTSWTLAGILSVACPPIVRAATISVPDLHGKVGDTLVVPITITGAVDLIAWQLDIAYDPTILSVTAVTEGPFMSAFGTTLFIPGVVDNITGSVSLVADLYVDLPPDPFGDGVLANIDLTILRSGESPLTLSNAFLNFSDQGFTVESGAVSTVPEPSTLILIGSSVGLILRRRDNPA